MVSNKISINKNCVASISQQIKEMGGARVNRITNGTVQEKEQWQQACRFAS